ncbi:alpha-L-fucosidase [Anaerosporobacter faecicola]|uniref:alpha-L-fucosidase n=1 Tax=Anaerosporobacter faecicola TaxID=2718714 RepID=UPI00143C138D|nr:alpha-L-fucosidase [Anaerosporobacter faecicola]
MEEQLKKIDDVIAKGKYKETWDSLLDFDVPSWFKKAKFGIFIHWGVYSVPANSNEWYSRNMYIEGTPAYEHHIKTYGPQNQFGYKDFIPMFKAEKFNPEEWAKTFKEAGAKYIFPVAEHHDGFQMYKSSISHYNAYEMGPKRDVLGELKAAFEKEDLVFCTSSHRAEHWFFMGHGKEFDSDIKDPMKRGDFYWPAMSEPDHQDLYSNPYPSKEFLDDWLIRTCEIIDNYKPKVLYFDWWIQHEAFKPYLRKLAAYYYNRGEEWGEEVAITYKHDAFMFGSAIVEIERGKFADQKPYYWQTDTAVARNTWCYTEENDYKSSREIILDLVDVVSKNGNMLLNIGPKADGTIPEGDAKILREVGAWLKVNGEAIYNSKVWRKAGEGPTKEVEGQFQDSKASEYTKEDIRFTVNGGAIYATFLNYPLDGATLIRSLAEAKDQNKPEFHGIIRNVEVLGFDEIPEWSVDKEGLHIKTQNVTSENPIVMKITLD